MSPFSLSLFVCASFSCLLHIHNRRKSERNHCPGGHHHRHARGHAHRDHDRDRAHRPWEKITGMEKGEGGGGGAVLLSAQLRELIVCYGNDTN